MHWFSGRLVCEELIGLVEIRKPWSSEQRLLEVGFSDH